MDAAIPIKDLEIAAIALGDLKTFDNILARQLQQLEYTQPLFFEPCRMCNSPEGLRRRQNTAYHDDSMNFSVLCSECQKDANEYWDSMWSEYYSMIL